MANDFVERLQGVDKLVFRALSALDVETLSDISRSTIEKVIEQLAETQTAIFDAAVDNFLPQIESLATYEAEFEARSLKEVLAPQAKARIKVPPAQKAYQEAIKRPIQATGEKLEPFARDWSARAIKRVNGAVRIGIENGRTVQQIVQNVRGTKAANYKNGIVAMTNRDATAMVHTAVQHTASTARVATWEENSDIVTGYEWVSTLDASTTTQCRSLDGKTYTMGKGPLPPLHIRCRSTTAAQLDKAFDFLDEGATRSSMDGYVSADLTYYDWLKKQPAKFQDSVLGPTRGKLLRAGGLTAKRFADLQLGRNFEPLTLAEMRKLEPHAFERAGL